MFTLKDCKDMVLGLIDEESVDGQYISASENADYLLRVPQFANKVQFEIAKIIKIPAVFRITQNHIVNQLGNIFGFDIVQYSPRTGPYILSAVGTLAYYFEVDNLATITFKSNGTIIKTINNTVKGEFTTYKGNLTIGNINSTITVEFTGLYVYNIRNTCLYDVPFESDSDVSTYKPYTFYTMPNDFMDLDNVILEGNERVYRETQGYFWENKKTLRISYYEVGSFDVHYWKYPTKLSTATPDTYEFEVYEEAAQLIPFKVASLIIQSEKADISARLLQIYETDLTRIANKQTIEPSTVQSVFTI